MPAALSIGIGIALIAITIADIFQSVIVPRPAGRRYRPSAYLSRFGWQTWRAIAHRMNDNTQREDFLGTYGPLQLVVLLIFWVVVLIFGYGFVFYGLRDQLRPAPDFPSALYFAGTSLLTIGYGDITPTGGIARFFSLSAGASGFGVVAIVTTYLFAILGAFHKRESFVVAFTNRAGAPPSGLETIKIHAQLGLETSLTLTLRESQMWMADVMETHIAYPTLTYFRSNHDNISWIGVFGALLDTSTLVMTTLDLPGASGEAAITNRLARHFVNDFSHYFGFEPGDDVGVERTEFDVVYDKLGALGIKLHPRDEAWQQFALLRSTYANRLNEIASWWLIPPAQWVGDRSIIAHHPPLRMAFNAADVISRT
ncbi:MAG: hypothetical protein NVSMB64_08970 [Candidatus Velthaea sp.]